ncbi:glycosyltransferase family 4 protein [Chroococcidiopsis thermalis]|uniref:Glycosyl transferase group 1 n=1 Tax=Chroococcidiopsis thermalis (strain PCC 7203) TaxID=251229 RepID=K9TUG0_CHRTP|nr:glycosyltransferase family 4 protein [Chroococcidiopsis thermalis]AFY85786.1 glycosyl transferase group 1 [Chroococcidiopsis thermalis PCC 7203]
MISDRLPKQDNSVATPARIDCVGMGWFPHAPGGLDRYVYELTHHLAAAGDRVTLYGLGLPILDNSAVELVNLAAPDRPLWKRLWSTRCNFAERQLQKPDAINLNFALYSLPLLQNLPKNVPVTFTFHGPWALESAQEGGSQLSVLLKQHLVEKTVYRRCDRFIVLSRAFGEILHQTYQVPWHKINTIPGGVDLQRFQPNLSRQQARTHLNFPSERLILFAPRRLVHRMGLDKLLLALAQIKPKIPDVWLAIAGKGPLKPVLEQQVAEMELQEHVKFLGFLPDEQLPIAYQAADLCVMPSQSLEGFGLTVLESLACGTPVLCTPIGGMPEILAPFSPELITDTSEATAIAWRLAELLTDPSSLPSRDACRQYAATHFDWQKIVLQVRQVLLR